MGEDMSNFMGQGIGKIGNRMIGYFVKNGRTKNIDVVFVFGIADQPIGCFFVTDFIHLETGVEKNNINTGDVLAKEFFVFEICFVD